MDEISPELYEMYEKEVGVTKEELDKLFKEFPGEKKMMLAVPELEKYRIVAEVFDSKYCYMHIDKGQKYVFVNCGRLDPEQSTAALCPWAIANLIPYMDIMVDRICEGIDPNGAIWRIAECPDKGIEHGGLGKVHFKLTAEKVK